MKPIDRPIERVVRLGLWGLPLWALGLLVGTLVHQPPPQTDIGGWSRFVNAPEFLPSHLFGSILGQVLGVLGMVALAVFLVSRGSVRLGLWALVTGITGSMFVETVFGVAAYTQPAVGRVYLAGHAAQAQALYYDATQGPALVAVALLGATLITATVILFGVAIARSGWLPRAAGIGLAVSGPLLFVIGFALDNWIQTVGSALLLASTVWIALAAWRGGEPVPAAAPVPGDGTNDVQVGAAG